MVSKPDHGTQRIGMDDTMIPIKRKGDKHIMKIRFQKLAAMITAGILGVSAPAVCFAEEKKSDANTVGTFETTDIEGKEYTEKIFEDYDLTMVNVFATWCTPCIQELPELQKLYEEVEEKGVNIVGIVLDAVDEKGSPVEEGQEKAKILKERAEITYPLLVPDSGYLNGHLEDVDSVPETFFVDKDGNIVGETYVGSNNLDGWKEVVEKELENLKGEK